VITLKGLRLIRLLTTMENQQKDVCYNSDYLKL